MFVNNDKRNAPLHARLLDGLVLLRDKGPVEHGFDSGICINVRQHMKDAGLISDWENNASLNQLMRAAFRVWPEFSGDIVYPVPAPEDFERPAYWLGAGLPELCYDMHSDGDGCWGSGAYNDARRRLLDFMIEYFGMACDAPSGWEFAETETE